MAQIDNIFIDNIKTILKSGSFVVDDNLKDIYMDGRKATRLKVFGLINHYDVDKEFPILTILKQDFGDIVEEVLWTWKDKSDNIKKLVSHKYEGYADKEGTIRHSFGYPLTLIDSGDELDQVDRLIDNLKNNRYADMTIDLYDKHSMADAVVKPSVYSVDFSVTNGRLNILVRERYVDVLFGVSRTAMYFSILMTMLCKECGLEKGDLCHIMVDAYIYDRNINACKNLIKSKPLKAPRLVVDPSVNHYYDFNLNSFFLADYDSQPPRWYLERVIKR